MTQPNQTDLPTRKTFSDEVRNRLERFASDTDSLIIDFVLDYASEIGIDEKNAGYLIDRDLKDRIELEVRARNGLKD